MNDLRVFSRVAPNIKKAKKEFQRLLKDGPGKYIPVRGLGDEAQISRSFGRSYGRPGTAITLNIRKRNALFSIDITSTYPGDKYKHGDKSALFGDLDAAVSSVIRRLLARLDNTSPAPALSKAPADQRGEITKVKSVSDSLKSGRLRSVLPGAKPEYVSNLPTISESSVYGYDHGPLQIIATATPASKITGESGSQLAKSILNDWTASTADTRIPNLGDNALTFTSGDEGMDQPGTNRILVQRGNLLVYVLAPGPGHNPSIKEVTYRKRKAIEVARAVLADNK